MVSIAEISMSAAVATRGKRGILTPLIPAAAIAFLTVGVNLVVDWFLHKASGIKDV